VEEELKIMQSIATGHITTIMTTHAISYGYNISIVISQIYTCIEAIIPYEMVSNKYHVFILASDTANFTG
jgi:hypothetical protein